MKNSEDSSEKSDQTPTSIIIEMDQEPSNADDDSHISSILAEMLKQSVPEKISGAQKSTTCIGGNKNKDEVSKDSVPLADVTFITSDGGTIKAHQLILSLRSEIFSEMLLTENEELTDRQIVINDFHPYVVTMFVDYFYTESVDAASVSDCGDLFALARLYQVTGLNEQCEARLLNLLCSSNVIDILSLGDKYQVEGLRVEALRYIAACGPQLAATPAFAAKLRQYVSNSQPPTVPTTSPVPFALPGESGLEHPMMPPVVTGMDPLRQLFLAMAGVGPQGPSSAPIPAPGGCACHTCRVYRSSSVTYLTHASLTSPVAASNNSNSSPGSDHLAVAPQLFDSPLTFDESSSVSAAKQTGASGESDKSSADKTPGDDEKSSPEDKRAADQLRADFDDADAKRRRLGSPPA